MAVRNRRLTTPAAAPAVTARTPVQLALPDVGPLACDGPAVATLTDERQAAIAASRRLLDAIEQRAQTQPGIRDEDRRRALATVEQRRARLEREAQR